MQPSHLAGVAVDPCRHVLNRDRAHRQRPQRRDDPQQGRSGHGARPGAYDVAGHGLVAAHHDDDATAGFGGDQLPDDVVGDHAFGTEDHPHAPRAGITVRTVEAAASKTTVVSAPERATTGPSAATSLLRWASRLAVGQASLVTL